MSNAEGRPADGGAAPTENPFSASEDTPRGTPVAGLEKVPAGARVVHVLGQGSEEHLDALNAAGYPSVALTVPWEEFAAAPAGLPQGPQLRLVCRAGESDAARAVTRHYRAAKRAGGEAVAVALGDDLPAATMASGRRPVPEKKMLGKVFTPWAPASARTAQEGRAADGLMGRTMDRARPRTFAEKVAEAVERKRANREADRVLAKEEADLMGAQFPEVVTLTEELKIPDSPVQYRVAGLWPVGGKVVLAAQYKAGKTTMVQNLARSLADGKTFLGHPVEGRRRVAVIDTEMDRDLLRRLYREQKIGNTDDVTVIPLRGKLATFNLLDPYTRARWVSELAGYQVVILDCLRPVLDAVGLDEDREAGQFLRAFDSLLLEMTPEDADVNTEGIVVHHTGHGGDRARGSSVILDWPDANWRLNLEDAKKPDSTRLFSAYGRGVNVGESALVLGSGNHLSIDTESGNRTERRRSAAEVALVDFLKTQDGPVNKTTLENKLLAISSVGRKEIREATTLCVERGTVLLEVKGKSLLYELAPEEDEETAPAASSTSPENVTGGGESPDSAASQ